MRTLPEGYTDRPLEMEDLAPLTTFLNAYVQELTGEDLVTSDQMRSYLTQPGFERPDSTRLVLTPENRIAGFSMLMDVAAPHVMNFAWGDVAHEERGRGIGSYLHQWLVDRAHQTVSRAPAGARVALIQSAFEQDSASREFLLQAGYVESRHFWRMAIPLTNAPATPEWPEGIQVQTVDLRSDLERPLRATEEAFQDHYGYVDGDFEQQLEQQRHNIENDRDYTPSLSFLAMADDEIAGMCFCTPRTGTDPSTGYVSTLGVLRPWRRQGLGLALLLHALGELRKAGKCRATLHVDAQSLTGATRLYEKAGMHVDQFSHEYQLELRPGIELATQQAS